MRPLHFLQPLSEGRGTRLTIRNKNQRTLIVRRAGLSRKPERKPSIPTISQPLEPRICVTKNINYQQKEARFLFLQSISHPHRLCGRAAATQIRFAHCYLCRAATPHGFLKGVVDSYKGQKDQLPVMIAVKGSWEGSDTEQLFNLFR